MALLATTFGAPPTKPCTATLGCETGSICGSSDGVGVREMGVRVAEGGLGVGTRVPECDLDGVLLGVALGVTPVQAPKAGWHESPQYESMPAGPHTPKPEQQRPAGQRVPMALPHMPSLETGRRAPFHVGVDVRVPEDGAGEGVVLGVGDAEPLQ